MPTVNREDYLKQVLLLEPEAGSAVRMGQLAVAVGVTPASATGMVKTLVGLGLVDYEPYAGVRLTPQGRKLALHVLRRHRLLEAFLVQTLGVDWADVNKEADAIEHVVSDDLVERIDVYLGRPTVDPHGDPIPQSNGEYAEPSLKSLAECKPAQEVVIARIIDQDPEFLRYVEDRGLRPGAALTIREIDLAGRTITVDTAEDGAVTLGISPAGNLLVESAAVAGS